MASHKAFSCILSFSSSTPYILLFPSPYSIIAYTFCPQGPFISFHITCVLLSLPIIFFNWFKDSRFSYGQLIDLSFSPTLSPHAFIFSHLPMVLPIQGFLPSVFHLSAFPLPIIHCHPSIHLCPQMPTF